jgi:L-ascorbate metabolism protein UlaG (beta-lactamase superfamily)
MTITYTYIGHGTHALDINGAKILIDPYLADNPSTGLSPDSIEADVIVISHGHGDHISDAIPVAQRTGAKVIANFEIVGWLEQQGVSGDQLHPQHLGGGFKHDFGYLKFTIAHHGSGLPDGSYGGNPAGLLFYVDGKKLYFACDTALFSDMKLYGDEGLDLAVVPIGDNFTMGSDDALKAIKLLAPKQAVPCHYNTWPLIEQDAGAWKQRVEAETDTKVSVLAPGGSLVFDYP